MVGGGIFAVLGLAVQLAHGGTPMAFMIAGVVALLTSYSYVRLSLTYPSQGGTVIFVDKAFGIDLFTGTMNNLLWLSYIVMLSLYAHAFGSYAASLFPPVTRAVVLHVAVTLAVLIPAVLNLVGAKAVGNAETYIVAVKLALLLFFVAVGVWGIEWQRVSVANWSGPVELFAGGMIIFLAYEGFELIANAADDIGDKRKTLPKAFYAAVIFVIVLYVLVSLVAVGNLSVGKIAEAKDYALAAAARPFLGQTGFVLIAVAALLSTFSAINATLYGSARLSYTIAKQGELPPFLEKKDLEQTGRGFDNNDRAHADSCQFRRSDEHINDGQRRISGHIRCCQPGERLSCGQDSVDSGPFRYRRSRVSRGIRFTIDSDGDYPTRSFVGARRPGRRRGSHRGRLDRVKVPAVQARHGLGIAVRERATHRTAQASRWARVRHWVSTSARAAFDRWPDGFSGDGPNSRADM